VVLIGDDELVDHVIGVYPYAVGCGIASEPAHISVEVSGGNHLLPYNLLAQVFHHLQTDVLTISLARCAFRVSGCEFRVSGRVWVIGFRGWCHGLLANEWVECLSGAGRRFQFRV
jgi:hypothetical protein